MRCAMGNKVKKVLSLIYLFLALSPAIAHSAEIPLLTWERGQIQEVVLGGQAAEEQWRVELQGNGITSILFQKSSISNDGFVVYSLEIPSNLPVGGYSVVAIDSTGDFNVVAGISLIEDQAYSITTQPLDLALIITIFVFLTAVISALRARKYAQISFVSTQTSPEDSVYFNSLDSTFMQRIASAPYRIRVRTIERLPNSILRFLLIRNGELLHRASHKAFALFPIFGFFAGLVAVIETERAGGIGGAGLAIFIGVGLIGILDAYSGLMAVLAFWLGQLMIGNISSFADILMMISVGISWLLPILFASIIQSAIYKDFSQSTKGMDSFVFRILGIAGSAFAGGTIFYFGQKLLNSVLVNFGESRNVSALAFSVIVLAIIIRGVFDFTLLRSETSQTGTDVFHDEEITISRICSPATAGGVMASVFAFAYIWTNSAQKSLIIALIFSAPYLVLLVRFNEIKSKFFAKAKRNILIESLIAAAITFLLFTQISDLPLLSQDKAQLFLILAGIPGLVHAIYSAACDSSDRQEIIS